MLFRSPRDAPSQLCRPPASSPCLFLSVPIILLLLLLVGTQLKGCTCVDHGCVCECVCVCAPRVMCPFLAPNIHYSSSSPLSVPGGVEWLRLARSRSLPPSSSFALSTPFTLSLSLYPLHSLSLSLPPSLSLSLSLSLPLSLSLCLSLSFCARLTPC